MLSLDQRPCFFVRNDVKTITIFISSCTLAFISVLGVPVGSGAAVKVFARCSDPNIICDTKTTQPGEPQDVFIKVRGDFVDLAHKNIFAFL